MYISRARFGCQFTSIFYIRNETVPQFHILPTYNVLLTYCNLASSLSHALFQTFNQPSTFQVNPIPPPMKKAKSAFDNERRLNIYFTKQESIFNHQQSSPNAK